jgi:WD repeat and SOF domain-containing protein 1
MWNIAFRSCLWSVKAHSGFVRGCVSTPDGSHVYSCGDDKTVKLWEAEPAASAASAMSSDEYNYSYAAARGKLAQPLQTYLGQHAFTAIDHQFGAGSSMFATAGVQLDLWDRERSEPLHSFAWGADSISSVKFNPVQHEILVSSASDRNIVLYDVRARAPLRKLIMQMNTNAIAWNPMEAFNFTIANEDHNCYTFDMRKLKSALCVHMDHVSAVMALDYAPTGREFATGGYDRTVRIFGSNEGRSREVYHTKRMQRIFAIKFSGDAKYVLSGSDDTNIRAWKAQASMPIKPLVSREKAKLNYANKLKERFKSAPEISRIARHRHVPKAVLSATRTKTAIKEAENNKAARIRAHTKPGTLPFEPERKKHILKEVE